MAGNTINMYGGSYVDVHDNEVVNLSIEKATVSVQEKQCDKPQDNTIKDLRKEIVEEVFSLIENGDWVRGITSDDIKTMMASVLGMGETPLSGEQKKMSEELWKMFEHGRGDDRVRVTWQNMVGYFIDKKLLNVKSAPELNKDFFGDKEGSDNINKGRNGRLSAVTRLLDAYIPKLDKKG